MNDLIDELSYMLHEWLPEHKVNHEYNSQSPYVGLTLRPQIVGVSDSNDNLTCPIRRVSVAINMIMANSNPAAYSVIYDAFGTLDQAMVGWEPQTPGWTRDSALIESSNIESINLGNTVGVTMVVTFTLLFQGIFSNRGNLKAD